MGLSNEDLKRVLEILDSEFPKCISKQELQEKIEKKTGIKTGEAELIYLEDKNLIRKHETKEGTFFRISAFGIDVLRTGESIIP